MKQDKFNIFYYKGCLSKYNIELLYNIKYAFRYLLN